MPAVKKTVAPAKRAVKKTASSTAVDPLEDMANEVAGMIKGGALDSFLSVLDTALTDRMEAYEAEQQKKSNAAAAKKTAQKVPEVAPKKSAPASATVTPVTGEQYRMLDNFPKIGKQTVEFVRFRKDDVKKAVVQMVTGAPGFPKGKQTVVPVAALTNLPAERARRTAKKSTPVAAKKTVARKK